jgi:hypothetical protein
VATPKQFRRRGRWTLIVGALLAALTFGAVMAFASGSTVDPNPFPWTNHQGVTGGALNTSLCGDSADFSGVDELPPGATADSYLLWIFTAGSGNTITKATLTINGTDDTTWPDDPWTTSSGGTIKFVTKAYDLDTLTAEVSYDGVLGNGNHNLTISHGCVGKAQPKISTTASTTGTGVTGDTFKDTAHLSDGTTSPAISGKITFRLYAGTDTTCSTSLYSEDVTVNGNGDYTTATGFPIVTKGTYTWTAEYFGDDNNEGAGPTACGEASETLDFKADTPDIETAIHLGSSVGEGTPTVVGGTVHVDLGSTVHDSATATGGPSTPEGTVAFTFYTTIDCTTDENHPSADAGSTVALVNGVAHPSSDEAALAPGSYSFKAVYTSSDTDKWQSGSESLCEPLTVDKGTLAIVTKIHNASHGDVGGSTSVPLGSVVHDTAHVTGQVSGFDPDLDKVGFAFYTTIDCTGDGSLAGNTGPDNSPTNLDRRSGDTQALGAGSYSFQARFAGDANYNPVKGSDVACEPLTVDKGTLTIVTNIHNSAHNVVTFVPVGGVVHDTAGVTAGQVTGFNPDLTKVGFVFYNTIDCTGDGALAGNTGPDEVVTSAVRTGDTAPLASGAYSFRARFAGDDNYNPVLGSSVKCEPLSVRTFGKTMGFYGNPNGQALLLANNAFTTPQSDNQFAAGFAVTLGIKNGTCYIVVDSAAKSKTVLPVGSAGLNGASILTNCTTTASRDSGINVNTLNTLLGQTLALSYNILYKSGFAGQTIGAFGPAAVAAIPTVFPTGQSLTASSTVEEVRTYANYLIAHAKSGDGVTISQTMIGQLNTLLGLINAEA